jgi:hypothetical protein
VLVVLAACSGSSPASTVADGGADVTAPVDGSPTPGEGGTVGCTLGADSSSSGACADLACVTCGLSQQCSPALFSETWTDRATCQARTQSQCEQRLADPAVKTGATATAACAAASTGLDCAAFLTSALPAACASVPGAVAQGEACTASAQCVTGRCGYGYGTYPCGTCEVPRDSGSVCISTDDCAQGMTCTIPGGLCAPYVQQGGACMATSDCLPTLVCQSGACVTPLDVGVACTTDAQGNDPCNQQQGLWCSGMAGKTTCTSVTSMCGGGDCAAEATACCAAGTYCFEADIGGQCAVDAPDNTSCAAENVPSGQGPSCLPPAVCGPSSVCTLYVTASQAATSCKTDGG